MSAFHVRSGRLRILIGSLLLAGLVAGCGESPTASDSTSADNPRAGARRKEQADFMKNQKTAGNSR